MSKKVLIGLAAAGLMLALAGSAGAQLGQGNILIEEWLNTGGAVTDNVDTLHTYINSGKAPTKSYWAKKMDRPDGGEDNWGGRMRGYIIPTETGDYTFWTASDDDSEVWLSANEDPANAKMICNVEGWMNYQDWTYTSGAPGTTYKSAAIKLEAGKRYYVDVFFADGTGGGFDTVAWGGPGIGAGPVVVDGKYLAAFIRSPEPLFKATNPDPANGKTEVTSPLFQWTAGATAAMHEVYMGTNPTPGAAEFMGPWPTNMYFHIPGLTPGATYYWRVDEVDGTGAKITGDVWSFTVQPLEAHFPSPVDGALWRPTNTTVSWTAGQGAVSHKVYGGEDKAAVAAGDAGALLATVTEAKLDASTLLKAGKTYYWRVDEVDSTGKVTAGPVWSFSTVDPAGGAVAEYWNGMNLIGNDLSRAGKPVLVTTVPNVNFSWPSGSVKGTNSPDASINTDYFGARFTAQLNVPVSGKYKLIESTDDGGLLYLNGTQVAGAWANGGEAENASANLDLVAGQQYIIVLEYYEATGGAAARLRWSGPGIAKEIIPQGALQIPQCAISPSPADRSVDVPDSAVLSFTPGPKAIAHTIYFGTDKTKVSKNDPSVALPPTDQTTYIPAKLDWNTTYYWKVDEVAADGTTIPGLVWSFTTANFVVINLGQKTLNYNNTLDPFISQLELDVPADLTKNGVTDLALRFQGQAAAQGALSFDAATGTYSVGGAGTDIWGNADQFTYAYKALEGDGTMIARVVSDDGKGANEWSKAGVMIRETLAAGSTHAFMPITAGGGNGRSFQRRLVANLASTNADGPAPKITAPYWVKIERKGNDFSGYVSADANEWVAVGTPVTIVMKDPVFIGLAVTSHLAGTMRTWTFDSVSTTGNVVPAGPFAAWEIINTAQNDPAPLYVALEDKAGKMAMVTNPNPAAVNTTVMDLWRIPMSAFEGVDLTNAAKMYIGVGDGKPDGSGVMNFADIRVVKPAVLPDPAAIDVTVKGDVVKGFPDYAGAWPAAEYPDLIIDDSITTKYLNFGGKTQPPSGFCVTPAMGATVVTGLTFTTANDAAERDPVAWELSGSNTGIGGPWALIAKGAIDDFARPIDWPRRWKSVTPIGFANKLAFLNYKVSFTTLKRFAAANSMQIAEVELLGTAAAAPSPQITWVSFHASDAPSTAAAGVGFTEAPDKGYTDLLKANGYAVVRYLQTGTPDLGVINASNLVIVSRSLASSSFQNAAADTWNGVTAPMVILNSYIARKSRMGFNTGSTIPDTTGDITLTLKDPAHPIFAGITLTGDTMTNPFAGIAVYPTDGTKAAGLSIVTEAPTAGGTVLATVSAGSTTGPAGAMVIAEWPAGATLTHDGGAKTNVLGGPRLVFLTGSRENGGKSSETAGMYDLSADGAQMFLNAVQYMLK